MVVLHLGEDPAVKEQSLIHLADIIKGKEKNDNNNMTSTHVTSRCL